MSKEVTYKYYDDEGVIYELTFEEVMEYATNGIASMPDGKILRRVPTGNSRTSDKQHERTEILSDSLGFSKLQLKEMQAHLELTGCRGVEFVQDKTEETFMQVRCDSPQALSRYMKARGFHDQNSRNGSGAMLSELDLENAKELVLRKHG